MAVRSSGEALSALQSIIGGERRPYRTLLHDPYLPDNYNSADPTAEERRWLWSDPPPGEVGGYGNPETYRLAGVDPVVWLPPGEVLPAGAGWSEESRASFRRHSVDLTMRGGTTSGVVYPLAVCEIATHFRVRNVGGASAGAIAAAATAAAELGRSSAVPDGAYSELNKEDREAGRVRPGFVGMADTIAWLAQITPNGVDTPTDQHRLAQLFRPAPADRRVFAVATALMRHRLWAVPLTALLAFGKTSKAILALLMIAGVVVTAAIGARLPSWPAVDRPAGGPGWADPPSLAWAALDLVMFFVALGALLTIAPVVARRAAAGTRPPDWLTALSTVSSQYRALGRRASITQRLLVGLVLLALVVTSAAFGWWHWVASALAGTALSALLVIVVAVSVGRYLSRASARQFGLVAGAAPQTRRGLSELLAGAAKPTVARALLPWLSDCLSQLAALPDGEVLRFGHLWQGREFTALNPQPLPPANGVRDPAWLDARARWEVETQTVRALSASSRHRLVNLELITTDLNRQRPYRFPLPWFDATDSEAEALYFCPADLVGDDGAAIFADDVMMALKDSDPLFVHPDRSGSTTLELYRLPDPWNLPVVFAVRLSLALPALFKAVRLYRMVPSATVRDDLGVTIRDGAGQELSEWPGGKPRAEELWFSDGGITSNFPVHLFDAALPAWPTFGLNLGPHPYGFPHQDVWLPQDWQATLTPASEFGPSATAFLSTIVDTARSWRDTMQTGMPGYRGRVAWVRQRPDEGGSNLYMPREIIASMALRGAMAGARLTRRFCNPMQWDRYRWLRLRVALDNLQTLRTDMTQSAPVYRDILVSSSDFFQRFDEAYPYDPFSTGIDWFKPADERFWSAAETLLADLVGPASADPAAWLTDGGPKPHPRLTQIPPM